ncbi:hypothetical protein [Streptomyces sp. NPDC059991]
MTAIQLRGFIERLVTAGYWHADGPDILTVSGGGERARARATS